jgi:UDP-glucose 4-epimerase
MKSRCVVLGGSGFLGQVLCAALIERGFVVRSLSRHGRPEQLTDPNLKQVEWVAGTIGSSICGTLLKEAEHVFHLASTTLPASSSENMVFDLESNTVATLHMLQERVQPGARLYFLSSGGTVYGVPTSPAIAETHSTNPICAYGIHKLATEKYLYLLRHQNKLESLILRPSNIYGETQDQSKPLGAILHFASHAMDGTPIEIWGDGTVVRDYIHVEDVVAAILAAMQYAGGETVFNIGSGLGISLNHLVQYLEMLLGRTLDVRYSDARTFDVPVNVLDTSLAMRELNWKPNIALETGLSRVLTRLGAVTIHSANFISRG